MQQVLLHPPSLEMTQSTSQVTFVLQLVLMLCIYSGLEDCGRKDCVCRRMYLTYETFATYWFPILSALGIYCLLDGMFSFLITLKKFHSHLLVQCSSARVYFQYLNFLITLLIKFPAYYINFATARIRCGNLKQGNSKQSLYQSSVK